MPALRTLTLKGFKSIRELKDFRFNKLNVLIGANGAGKTNLISFFRLLNEIVERRLQTHVRKQGGANTFLFDGAKVTKFIYAELLFDKNGYRVRLAPTVDGNLFFEHEEMHFEGVFFPKPSKMPLGSGHLESKLPEEADIRHGSIPSFVVPALKSWRVYHFHDTSETASVKQLHDISDNRFLRADAGNLAAFLRVLRRSSPERYKRIRETVRLVAPFFDDFLLEPAADAASQIQLEWKQLNSASSFRAHHLSDGTLRFICLSTLLLQPSPPSTLIIDEPELGLHPFAISVLAALIHEVSLRTQLIISTQSSPLLDQFEPEDIIVVERNDGASHFKRLDKESLDRWLNDYSLSELVQKDVIESGPRNG
jgi:predicted ATPase